MGTAKKLDGTKFKIDTLNNTKYCPLAKKIRKSLSLDEQKYTTVVYSEEVQKDINVLGSISYVPAIAGLLICNAIINDIIKILIRFHIYYLQEYNKYYFLCCLEDIVDLPSDLGNYVDIYNLYL